MKNEIRTAARAVARDLLSMLKQPWGEARLRRALQETTGPIRISVGSGHLRLDGWLNTDVNWRAPLYLDLTKPWPMSPGSVSGIFADNVIEHFPLSIGKQVLGHMFTALAPGGRVRLVTPDVERTAKAYLHDSDLVAKHLDRHRRFGYEVAHPVDLLRVVFNESGHHTGYLYDEAALRAELQAAGFVDVTRCEVGHSNDPAFTGLEARVGETEAATSLILEAVKP